MVVISGHKEVVTQLTCEKLIHYTSINALKSILENKKIWMTHSEFLNDSTELNHFDSLFKESLNKYKQEKEFKKIAFVSEIERAIYEDDTYEHYILSMSCNPDSLSLWNYYGKKDGYNIIFNRSLWRNFCAYLKEINEKYDKQKLKLYFGEIIYHDNKKREKIKERLTALYEYWEKLDTNNYYHMREFQIAAEFFWKGLRMFFKNKAYKEEQEVRYVLSIPKYIAKKKLLFRTLEGSMVPYVEIPLNTNNLISGITIGPKVSIDIAQKGLRRFLQHNDMNIQIKKSEIPIRY